METRVKVGKFGTYMSGKDAKGMKFITIYPSGKDFQTTGIVMRIVVCADDVARVCTELIEMARVLGVTGQEKGNE